MTATEGLSFGANILFDDVGSNVLVLTGNANQVGDFKITGDLTCHNLVSTGTAVYNTVNNIATTNAIIEVAQNAAQIKMQPSSSTKRTRVTRS